MYDPLVFHAQQVPLRWRMNHRFNCNSYFSVGSPSNDVATTTSIKTITTIPTPHICCTMPSTVVDSPSADQYSTTYAGSSTTTDDAELPCTIEPGTTTIAHGEDAAVNAPVAVQRQPWTLERVHGWAENTSKHLAAATLAHQAGFVAAKAGTKMGLGIARFATKASLSLPAVAADAAMGTHPSNPWSRDASNRSVTSVSGAAGVGVDALFNFVDTITHGSIGIGENLSDMGLAASQRAVEQLKTALSSDVVHSLATFTRLLKYVPPPQAPRLRLTVY